DRNALHPANTLAVDSRSRTKMFSSIIAIACTGPKNHADGPGSHSNDSVTESQGPDDDTGQTSGNAVAFDGARPRNLLVVTLDTARRDYLGFFDDRGLAPNLDSIFS